MNFKLGHIGVRVPSKSLWAVLVIAGASACGTDLGTVFSDGSSSTGDAPCTPGDQRECTCASGAPSVQECLADGSAFGSCAGCGDGGAGPGGSGPGGSGPGGSGPGGSGPGGSGPGGAGPGGSGPGGAGPGGAGGQGGEGGTITACALECGVTELCDFDHTGTDDNCNGTVDEGCPCVSGQASACFKGDPSYRDEPGCHDGVMRCVAGSWGACQGGRHASTSCYSTDLTGCHPIEAVPYAPIDLGTGTGTFSNNALSESWTISCPAGTACPPDVNGVFRPMGSGEHTVTYTKTTSGVGPFTCEYPLFVGARGVRVELQWEMGAQGDLDLHVHKPSSTQPWATSGAEQDCGWSNCRANAFQFGGSEPQWFNVANVPPAPVNWYEDTVVPANNLCYFAPRGEGGQWSSMGMGCHNPRLEADIISCTPAVTDPDANDFCTAENTNLDFPPIAEWMRVGVHYYNNSGGSSDKHPNVKVFCDGALAAELGSGGYYTPSTPVTFVPTDGGSSGLNKFWLVGDVSVKETACSSRCVVQPLYENAAQKTPRFVTADAANAGFGPAYPALP